MGKIEKLFTLFSLTRYHCKQLFSSKRWFVVLGIDIFLSFMSSFRMKKMASYILETYHIPFSTNIWDVPFSLLAIGSTESISIYILIVAFIFLVGDVLLRDMQAGRLPMLTSRTQNRTTWFVSAIPAIFLSTFVFLILTFVVNLGVALFFLPRSNSWSLFLTSKTNPIVGLRSYNFIPGSPPSPIPFFFGVIGYLTGALLSIALFSIVASLIFKKTFAVYLPAAWLMLDLSMLLRVGSYPGAGRFFFTTQLAYISHYQYPSIYPFPVIVSVIVFCALCVIWIATGYYSVQHIDLL
jgi:hypothetical protein